MGNEVLKPRMLRSTAKRDIPIKSGRQIEKMRRAGAVVAATLDRCVAACQPGVTTGELDRLAFETFDRLGAEPLFRNYPDYLPDRGFPGNTCISVNDQIVHGIPGDRVICEGDVVTIDCGVRLDGWCADAARTIVVGRGDPRVVELVDATRRLLWEAIELVRPGRAWSEIARVMQRRAREWGYGVIREYVGHGIGRSLHEMPRVPNYVTGRMQDDFVLQPGLVIAIEPMLTLGTGETLASGDGWTVLTRDGRAAAHEEHTVAVTRTGADVLTRSAGGLGELG